MSPHMTGQRNGENAATDTISASDLLDADGRVDQSALASMTNGVADRDDRVQASESDTIRRELLRGATTTALAEELGYNPETIRAHAKGARDYPRNETPERPPLEYGPGGWGVADE